MKKFIGLILSTIVLSTMILGLVMTVNAEAVTIPNGDSTISVNGVYQLCEGYSGVITLANSVNKVKVTDSAYKASHTGTRIVIAGGRSELLELEIENLDINAAGSGLSSEKSGIDFANAGDYAHRLYISGVCKVAGSNAGIHVPDGANVIIDKAEGLSDSQAQLTATAGSSDAAGIGGAYQESGGDITIDGGTVTVIGYTFPSNIVSGSASGIGGGVSGAGGNITINGGIVTATGGFQGAAIGGGSYAAAGNITINGGTVTANAGLNGIGIGCGVTGDGGTIRITGGTVKAYGSGYRAGIGGGDSESAAGVTVIISGGTIEATGGEYGAGIGGSYEGAGGTIIIRGGEITATGGESASGIGGGYAGTGGAITISGGSVKASGGNYGGTGIGGGSDGSGGTISISGGTVTATGKNRGAGIGGGSNAAGGNITISGGTVTATGGSEAAGIGGGCYGAGADVTITGTPIILATGDTLYRAEHIGNGRPHSVSVDSGTLKDGADKALSYLRFSVSGVPQANIKIEEIEEINGEYQTTGPGLFYTFTHRSGTFTYTVSKTGYAAVKGRQEITKAVHEIKAAMIRDEIPPTISNIAPLILKTGTTIQISCNNYGVYGTLYLVQKTDLQYTSAAALEWTYLKKTVIESPATTAGVETSMLNEGSYQIYAVDSAENVSVPSKDIVINNTSQSVPDYGGGSSSNATVVSSYNFEVSIASLASQEAKNNILFDSPLGVISIPDNMLTGIEIGPAQKARVTLSQGDKNSLPSDVKKAIGEHPLMQITLSVDGRKVDWSNPNAPVTVSIQYTPTAEELKDPEHIVIWYIDGSGNSVSVPSGRYDPKTGMATFTTTHFSCFAVAYVTRTFSDLGSLKWAQKPIEVLASKGILMGTTKNEYAPQANITRADFLYSLVRTLSADAKAADNFNDIRKDSYYCKEIAIAKTFGITNGTGDKKFSPEASITRQDMMVMTDRALKMFKKLKQQATVTDLKLFTDKSLIASYAVESIASVVKEGLIAGNGNRINPLGNTTRAEAAVFLYRIYNK
jgi:hypothetical protein